MLVEQISDIANLPSSSMTGVKQFDMIYYVSVITEVHILDGHRSELPLVSVFQSRQRTDVGVPCLSMLFFQRKFRRYYIISTSDP